MCAVFGGSNQKVCTLVSRSSVRNEVGGVLEDDRDLNGLVDSVRDQEVDVIADQSDMLALMNSLKLCPELVCY